jgi:hypothetical protein
MFPFRKKASSYGEELLVLRPTPKLDDHPLSAVRDCLFSVFAATLHIGGRFSVRNLRTRHAVVTGTRLSRISFQFIIQNNIAAAAAVLCGVRRVPLKESSTKGEFH